MHGELERRVARLQKGDHLCLIFDSAAEQAAALLSFLKAGLSSRERCLWMAGAASSRRLERAFDAAGVDAERELERGALVLLSERRDWLLSSHFDPGQMLDLLRRAEQQALDDGFTGLRVAWDMVWLLEDNPAADRLVELEAHLNRFLQGSRTTILCQYSRTRSSPEVIHGVLRTHPLALLGERLCPNAYYEPPALVLGDLSPDERVDWMIAKLLQARSNERKLEEVTRRLAQNGAALKRADRAKEELLAMLAHELRNPLGTISNALQVLRLKGHPGHPDATEDETWKRAIDAAERQVHHQALLVDDLLEASRVTRGEIELNCERLDLVQLTHDTVEGYRETLRNAGLALDIELPAGPVPVHGDRLRLSQAVSNLLHNATKFTAPGGKITVRLSSDDHRAEISVCDTGVGISPEVLPHVFEVFSQADHSLDRAQGGLGVGLAVVRGLIEMHGGEVEAHSPGAGQGAELRLRLPLLEEDREGGLAGHPPAREKAAAALPRGEDHPLDARRILVVEDNPDHAATMRDFLELSGHQVELACSGTAGVVAAREFHPEVVLCDLGLPGMTGYEVAAELRRDPSTASAQLIAVTGYGGEDDRRRSREAGFDLHLTKPVDPGQLKRVLQAPVAATPGIPDIPANADTAGAEPACPAHTGSRA